MEVASLAFSWETLAKRDLRRDGHGDGVKGVYLGELVNLASLELLKNREIHVGTLKTCGWHGLKDMIFKDFQFTATTAVVKSMSLAGVAETVSATKGVEIMLSVI